MTGIDLYWLPLGAGGRSVRYSGRLYEASTSLAHNRQAAALFHSALVVEVPAGAFVVEMAPAWSSSTPGRGVIAEGPVGARWAGRSRYFRYEVRCWSGGTIDDIAEAVDSPQCMTRDETICRAILSELPHVPVAVWGRDELHTGEMWNSNSVTAWALIAGGIDARQLFPPSSGRAPGWSAGIIHALRTAREGQAVVTAPVSVGPDSR